MIKEEKVQKVDQKAREIQSRYASVVSSKKVARRLDELIIGVKRAMYIYISLFMDPWEQEISAYSLIPSEIIPAMPLFFPYKKQTT